MDGTSEPTIWEDTSPPMSRSVELHRPRETSLRNWRGEQPAGSSEIVATLAPCLALVAPTGFTRQDREEWLASAGLTLAERRITKSILTEACRAVRNDPACDHPSKIMAGIMRFLGDWEFQPVVENGESVDDPEKEAGRARWDAAMDRLRHKDMPQDEIDELPDHFKRLAWNAGLLNALDGQYWIPGKRPAQTQG